MRTFNRLASLMVALAACAGLALAHGGSFQGPSGGGTPGYSGPAGGGTIGPNPGGPDPGGSTPGGSTPGGGGGTTGGPAGGGTGPVRPTGGAPGGGGAGRGGVTPGRGKAKTESNRYLDWDWWWDLNEEPFLNLKRKVRSANTASDNVDTFLGAKDVEEDVAKVTLRQIRETIEPTLRLALKDAWYDARAGAVIALGKVGDSSRTDLVEAIKSVLGDERKEVRESACLALGILGSQDAIPFLFEVVRNTTGARKAMNREQKDIETRTRTFATVAIGLIGFREGFSDKKVLADLVDLVKTPTDSSTNDTQVGAALALGVVRSQDVVPDMISIVRDEEMNDFVRAHTIAALGKMGAKTAIADLVKLLNHKDANLSRSAAISLGLLVSKDDTAVINKLIETASSHSDRGTRNFSIIALGHIGNAKGKGWLENLVRTGKNIHDKTFAPLALGVMGFKHNEGNAQTGEVLLAEYKVSKADDQKAALAIGMGLLAYEPGIAALREDLERGGSQELKSHLCTALGLLGDRDSIPAIQELVRQRGDVDLRKRAAVALGLLGDPQAVDVLEKVILESSNSKGVLGAATTAMGFIGDRRAIPILEKMVVNTDSSYQDSTRAFATVALGFLGDKDDIPMLSRIQESSNYLAQTESLAEILSIL